MTQELGRIGRPSVEQYRGRRKLILLPLVYSQAQDEPDGSAALQNYWDQAQTQASALENALGGLQRVYHESVTAGRICWSWSSFNPATCAATHFVSLKCETGAVLEATEDFEILLETLDLQRCLMMPIASSHRRVTRLQEWHAEANQQPIRSTSPTASTRPWRRMGLGLLLISERHQVQFPPDIEVFYVSPPALDEFRRWLQNWAARQQQAAVDAATAQFSAEEAEDESTIDTPPV